MTHHQRRLATWAVIFKGLEFAPAKSTGRDAQQHFVGRRYRQGYVPNFKLIKRGVKKSFHKKAGGTTGRAIYLAEVISRRTRLATTPSPMQAAIVSPIPTIFTHA